MTSATKGFTLVEFMVAMAIAVIIAVPLFNALRATFNTWKLGSDALNQSQHAHFFLTPLLFSIIVLVPI